MTSFPPASLTAAVWPSNICLTPVCDLSGYEDGEGRAENQNPSAIEQNNIFRSVVSDSSLNLLEL